MSVFKDILLAIKALRPAPLPLYTVDFGVVAGGAGYAAELIPGGVPLLVRSVWFSKPSVSVTLESSGFDDQEWAGFLSRFEQAYQRGGG